MSRRTAAKTKARKTRPARTPAATTSTTAGHTPDVVIVDDLAPDASPAPAAPTAEAAPAGPADAPTTTIHDVPFRDEPIVFAGDQAMPGFEHLSFAELAQLAAKASLALPPGADDVLEGVVLQNEIAEAKKLLADAEERGESPLDLAHAYGYLDGVHKALGRQVKRTRELAEKMFAAVQLVHGMKLLEVMVDDGGPAAATIHIQDVKPTIAWDMGAVKAYCRQHAETELYTEVLPGVLALDDVIAYIAMTHPDYVKTRVREAYLTRLQSEIDDDGCIASPGTAELVKLAKVTRGERNGAFIIRYTNAKAGRPSGKDRIERMFRTGGMGDVLALGAGPEPDPDAAAREEV
ncbi:hypothetical protein [Nonomuraea sp. bgisy101]|uniref:hypothetical protein n=1 Tax=Nonomuraea sp. bgisy101 TaxID=3413784 RepID=UPI003D725318